MEEDRYELARFIKERRKTRGMSAREVAEIVSQAAGGDAVSVQGVQHWENTNPGRRTVRPDEGKLPALAEALGVSLPELYEVWKRGERHGKRVVTRLSDNITVVRYVAKGESAVAEALRERFPALACNIERSIAPYGIRRTYDYLSNNLAVEIIAPTAKGYVDRSRLDSSLWKLVWLQRLDGSMGVARRYTLLFIVPDADDDLFPVNRTNEILAQVRDEVRLFEDALHIGVTTSAIAAAEYIVGEESHV